MKHTVILFLFTVSGFICKGQNLFGIFAGPQATTAKYTVADTKQTTSHKYGFNAGACLKVPFENHIFFSPAIFYSLKGYKVKFTRYAFPPDTAAINNNTSIHTVEVALLLQFDMGNRPGHLFMKAGPSVDFQVGGKEKYGTKTGGSVTRAMPFSFEAYGHYSVNLLLQFGFETKSGFMVFAQFADGLTNINNADQGPQVKHRAFGISIGKYFNKKKDRT